MTFVLQAKDITTQVNVEKLSTMMKIHNIFRIEELDDLKITILKNGLTYKVSIKEINSNTTDPDNSFKCNVKLNLFEIENKNKFSFGINMMIPSEIKDNELLKLLKKAGAEIINDLSGKISNKVEDFKFQVFAGGNKTEDNLLDVLDITRLSKDIYEAIASDTKKFDQQHGFAVNGNFKEIRILGMIGFNQKHDKKVDKLDTNGNIDTSKSKIKMTTPNEINGGLGLFLQSIIKDRIDNVLILLFIKKLWDNVLFDNGNKDKQKEKYYNKRSELSLYTELLLFKKIVLAVDLPLLGLDKNIFDKNYFNLLIVCLGLFVYSAKLNILKTDINIKFGLTLKLLNNKIILEIIIKINDQQLCIEMNLYDFNSGKSEFNINITLKGKLNQHKSTLKDWVEISQNVPIRPQIKVKDVKEEENQPIQLAASV